ncbi:MAG: 2Fe-2S iron-sulfur cluster-binding protein [Oceanobacter sp.]
MNNSATGNKARCKPVMPQTKKNLNISVVDEDGACIKSQSDKNLLVNLAAAGQSQVLNGCKGGGCGKCKIKVTEGTYLSRKMSRAHISAQDEERDVVLACRIFPQSDLAFIPLEGTRKSRAQRAAKNAR